MSKKGQEWDDASFAGRVNASVDRFASYVGVEEPVMSSLAEDAKDGERKSVLRPKIARVREAVNEKLGAAKARWVCADV